MPITIRLAAALLLAASVGAQCPPPYPYPVPRCLPGPVRLEPRPAPRVRFGARLEVPESALRCDAIAAVVEVRNRDDCLGVSPPPLIVEMSDGVRTWRRRVTFPRVGPRDAVRLRVPVRARRAGPLRVRLLDPARGGRVVAPTETIRITEPALAIATRPATGTARPGASVVHEVTVANTGDGEARDARLEVTTPGAAPGRRTYELGDLAPGQSRTMKIELRPRAHGELTSHLRVTAFCAEATETTLRTPVVGIPAIRFEVVDETDPARVGADVVYRVTVLNQGTAPLTDLRLDARFEAALRVVDVTGATRAAPSTSPGGPSLALEPLSRLAPGRTAIWRITTRAMSPADARSLFRLRTRELPRVIEEAEATRIVR